MSALIARIFADYENCPFVAEEFPELAAPATHYGQKKRGHLWVIEDAQADAATNILGSIAITPTFETGLAELFKVYLAHSLRGTGVAATLLNQALDWARASGSHSVMLWTDTRFLAGHRFYEKHGFIRMPGIRALHDAASTFEFGYKLSLSGPVTP
jgi:putative acetyltransferase